MYQFLNLLMFDLSLINSKIDSNSCFTSQREREEQVREQCWLGVTFGDAYLGKVEVGVSRTSQVQLQVQGRKGRGRGR